MNETFYFEDKNDLVQYLYTVLTNPTQIKVQKTLYLLYAFYGATYGSIVSEESDFDTQNYPTRLFDANFEAWRYGPVEVDVYTDEKKGLFEDIPADFSLSQETPEDINVVEFIDSIVEQTDPFDDFSLVDRTHQDRSWCDLFKEGVQHIKMINMNIIEEYKTRYV